MRRALGGSNKGAFVRSICGLFLSSYAFEGLSLSTEVIIEFFFLGGAKNEDFSKNCESTVHTLQSCAGILQENLK